MHIFLFLLILPLSAFAFDRSNPADLAALQSEVLIDPAGMAYNPTGNTQDILDKLNLPENNVAPQNGAAPMTVEKLMQVLFQETISSQDQFKIDLLITSSGSLADDLSSFKADVKTLSPSISAAVDGIVRPLSRAEVLFAGSDENGITESITITRDDWIAARDYQP